MTEEEIRALLAQSEQQAAKTYESVVRLSAIAMALVRSLRETLPGFEKKFQEELSAAQLELSKGGADQIALLFERRVRRLLESDWTS